MDLTGFISITGQPGLYKIVAQSKNGIIVEGLSDKKRVNVYASTKVSTLTDISMFTTGDDKPINEIMTAIFDKEKGGPAVDAKADDKTVEAYFAQVLPDYDKERVYVSNMRKLFSWYNALQSTSNLKTEEENKDANDKTKNIKLNDDSSGTKHGIKKDGGGAKTIAGNKKTTGVRKTGTA
ncbi:MAG: DUF5606 domain-containing protein [Sphingobacteriaceae bacterium]|nr:DUF5606 domain-containing protein [Sphingobacteriaceae bacterium]MBK7816898.1 DUF5606 domain-containing protein [Sphingobacteriaceae bacterium]